MNEKPQPPADSFAVQAATYWQERGGRMTVVRKIICRSIDIRSSDFGAEELWQETRRIDRGISMASIYRTLSDLVDADLLREIRGTRDQRAFVKAASTTAVTGHLICKDCHRIVPLNDDCLALREGAMIRGLGFETGGMQLQIEATCESLKRCGTCANHRDPVV